MKYIGKYLCEEILLTSECICLNDYTIGGLYCQKNCYFYDIIYKICENIDIALYMICFMEFIISCNTSYTYLFVFISPWIIWKIVEISNKHGSLSWNGIVKRVKLV